MHDEPRPPATDGSGVSDLTERHSIPPIEPATAAPITPASGLDPAGADPAVSGTTWTTPTSTEPAAVPFDRFTPAPEPRADWTRSWDETAPVTPERWYEPAPVAAPTTAATPERTRSRGGSIVAAALLSAVLASGGTVLVLGATGALDRRATPARRQRDGTNVGRRPAGRDRRVVGDHRGRRQGQPGGRPDHGDRQRQLGRPRRHPRRPASAPASSSTATAGS